MRCLPPLQFRSAPREEVEGCTGQLPCRALLNVRAPITWSYADRGVRLFPLELLDVVGLAHADLPATAPSVARAPGVTPACPAREVTDESLMSSGSRLGSLLKSESDE